MKKFLLVLALLISAVLVTRAAVVILAGSGITIPATTITNFPQTVVIGQFTLSPTYLYMSQNGVTNGAVVVNGYITLDGTNRFQIPQFFQFATNGGLNGATNVLWYVTNSVFNVYGQVGISNGMASSISNLTIAIQQ